MKIKSLPVKFKTGDDDGLEEGQFLVYPSTFTRTPDSYGDVVAPGAFADDIAKRKESGAVLSGLYGHRMDDPHLNVASAIDEGEDDHGWWVKGEFDLDEPTAAKVYRLVKSGRIRELSFAFDVLDEGQVTLEDGTKANELRKLEAFEFSFVPVGANRDTSIVAVKALADEIVADVKAGRAISAKNETTLREAADKIAAAAVDIKNVLAVIDGEGTEGAGKASGHVTVKTEEPAGAKAEEPERAPSARTRLQIALATAEGATL
ncbi:HK97 family phage prohead protease [Microbacterium karelineae]|uniref:HK97 family phage prohead protease n=1 Tax=Microbacterium karelineae TaxID=2654283 RepID=UPI0012EA01D7|nr:HK97 family phage prohead protease [Microbacterium karelineae]